MKKLVLLAGLALGFSTAFAQDQHPNSDFEDWTDYDGYMLPDSLTSFQNICVDIGGGFQECLIGVEQTTDANTGTYAVKMTNVADADGDPTSISLFSLNDDFETITFTGRPDSLSGFYKFLQEGQDTAAVAVYLLKENVADPTGFDPNTDVVASGFVEFLEDANDYTQFYVPLTYISTDPVAGIFLYAETSEGDGTIGTTLYLDSFEFMYSNVTSTDETASSDIELFPNPATEVLNISGTFNSVEILSMDGTVVMTSSETQLNLSDLASGIYIARVHTDNGIVPQKLVID